MQSLQGYCSLCLCSKVNLKKLSTFDLENITYFSKLISAVPEMGFIQMDKHNLCPQCCGTVDAVFRWRQQCLRNIPTLVNHITKSNTDNKVSQQVFQISYPLSNQIVPRKIDIQPPKSPIIYNGLANDEDYFEHIVIKEEMIVEDDKNEEIENVNVKIEESGVVLNEVTGEFNDMSNEEDMEAEYLDEAMEDVPQEEQPEVVKTSKFLITNCNVAKLSI